MTQRAIQCCGRYSAIAIAIALNGRGSSRRLATAVVAILSSTAFGAAGVVSGFASEDAAFG